MPFESKAQARYMFAVKPKLAKEFAEKTLSIKNLPERKDKDNIKQRMMKMTKRK